MSLLSGSSLVSSNQQNSTSTSSYVGYWPGHVVAECLAEENDPESVSTDLKNLRKLTQKLSRSDSMGSDYVSNNNDVNNNNTSNSDMIKAAKLLNKLKPGSAFSAIVSSMVPFEILSKFLKNESARFKGVSEDLLSENFQEFVYDEFGFKTTEHNNKTNHMNNNRSRSSSFMDVSLNQITSIHQLNENVFIEDSKHKMKWIAYLEFTLNADIGGQAFSWDAITQLTRCEKLRQMIRGQGVPHSLRGFVWMRLSGALDKKTKSQFKYSDLCKSHTHDQYHTSKQIEKDLLRTLPGNACFNSINSVGIPRLRRILQAVAWLHPNIGYCQGMGPIAAHLLLFFEEEDAFWVMSAIIEDILPASYYAHTLVGVQADIKVLNQLISTYLPEIDQKFKDNDIELSLICINWFLTIFSNVFHMKILLRVWDLFFYEGSTAMFQITLAMLKLNEESILKADSSTEIFTILADIPSTIFDIDVLIEMSIRVGSSVSRTQVDTIRRKHQAYLMAQNGAIINPSKYESLMLNKEKSRHLMDEKGSSFINAFKNPMQLILWGFLNEKVYYPLQELHDLKAIIDNEIKTMK